MIRRVAANSMRKLIGSLVLLANSIVRKSSFLKKSFLGAFLSTDEESTVLLFFPPFQVYILMSMQREIVLKKLL